MGQRQHTTSASDGKNKAQQSEQKDTNHLLDLVEDLLPHGAAQWEQLAEQSDQRRAHDMVERTAEALASKFRRLNRLLKPTNDSSIPADVLHAKQTFKCIETRQ